MDKDYEFTMKLAKTQKRTSMKTKQKSEESQSYREMFQHSNRDWERIIEAIFFISAFISVLSIVIISVYIFIKGTPSMFEYGIFKFLFGLEWSPTYEPARFGIFAMIIASILGTFGAVVIGVPVGLFSAILLSEIAPKWIANIFRPCIELLAGIPSVVYGFFGLIVIVPLISKLLGGSGVSLLAMIIILAVMILPTIINISEASIRALPVEYKEGSLALGASHIETIFKVMVPAAKSGILASIVLGMGRAIGETMAVILVCGNAVQMPKSILDMVRPLTANIALEMSYATPFHEEMLFSTGVILFLFIMVLNIVLNSLIHRTVK